MTKTKIFISYARDDDHPDYNDPSKSFVRKLYNDLKALGFEVWWDRKSMPSRGLTFLQEIRDAITERDWLLLVVGHQAIKSDYVRAEWEYALNINKTIIPLLRGGFGNQDDKEDFKLVPKELGNFNALDFRPHKNYDTTFEQLVKNLEGGVQTLAPLLNVPAPPAHYLAREADLTALKSLVMQDIEQPVVVISADKQITATQGMGGVGKSVIAAAFGRDLAVRRSFRDGIVWVTVGTKPSLLELLQQIAVAIEGRPVSYTDENTAKQLLQKNLTDKTCLIILDDVWDYKVVEPFRDIIAQTRCRILLTTRQRAIARELNTQEYKVKLLTPEQALALLQDWTGLVDPELGKVAEKVEYLPLALRLAGGRIRKGLSVAEWLATFTKVSQMTVGRGATDRLESLETSIEMGMSAVFGENTGERLLYHTFGIFGDDVAIPQSVVIKLWQHLRADLDKFECQEILDQLVDLALIDRSENHTITLHDLLHSYTHEKLGRQVVKTHQDLLTAYNPEGKPWHEIPHDGYLYFHLAYHLIEAGRKGDLVKLLVSSPEWMEKKYTACVGDTSLVQDLELAWAGLADPLTPEQAFDVAQLYTVRQTVNARVSAYDDTILETLVWLGRKDEALAHARLRSGYQEQTQGLLAIYQTLQKQGQPDLNLLAEVHQVTLKIKEAGQRGYTLSEVVKIMAQGGQVDNALIVAQGIESARERGSALSEIAVVMAQGGQVDNALVVAHGLESARERDYALRAIAQVVVQAGDSRAEVILSQALVVAHGLESARERSSALSEIAVVMAQGGQVDNALVMAQRIEETGERDSALSEIVKIMAQGGQVDNALVMAQRIEEAGQRGYTLSEVVKIMAQGGQVDNALVVAQSIESARERSSALSEIVKIMAQLGQVDNALVVAQSIEEVRERGSALSAIAMVMAQGGQVDTALGVAHGLEEVSDRTSALSEIVKIMAQLGQVDNALVVAQSIEEVRERGSALSAIAKVMAQMGDSRAEAVLSQALGVAHRIESAWERGYALSEIIKVMAQVGQVDNALVIAQRIEKAGERSYALSEIAKIIVQAGQVDTALVVAQGIESAWERGSALSEIAKVMAQTGDNRAETVFSQALGVAHGVEDAYYRSEALSEIAKVMAQTGDNRAEAVFSQALGVAHGLESARERGSALSEIAKVMARAGDSRAEAVFSQALRVTWGLKFARERGSALIEIVKVMVQLGQVDNALGVAHGLEEAWQRGYALREIAMVMAQVGQVDNALEVAQRIVRPNDRAEALREIAKVMAQAEDSHAEVVLSRALELTQAIEEAGERNSALRAIAKVMAQTGQLLRAFQILPLQEEPAKYLQILAEWQPAFDQIEQGLSLKGLREAVRIVGWVKPQWREIHVLLEASE